MSAFKGLGTYGNGVGVVTPSDHKQDDAGLVIKQSGNLIRPGLFWGGTATIVTGTAGMAYSVAAYTCASTRGSTSGAVLGGNDGAFSVTTTAAPGSNSRYDVVYHWQREYALDGVDSNPVIGVVQGTAAASPTVPSLAAFPGAIALATILVPAGVTATNTGTTITQTAPFTATAGGIFPVRNQTEKAAVVATESQSVYLLDSDWLETFDGAVWNLTGGKTPIFQAVPSVGQSISASTVTTINWTGAAAPAIVRGFTFSAGVLTATRACTVIVTGLVTLAAGSWQTQIWQNGNQMYTDPNGGSVSGILSLAAGDTISLKTFASTATNTVTANGQTYLTAAMVAA